MAGSESADSDAIPRKFPLWLRAVLAAVGLLSFGTGVLAVFTTENTTGTAVLIAFGGIVFVLALLGDRIETMEFGSTRLRMRAAAAERYALAEESEALGEEEAAERMRHEADALMTVAAPLAADYRKVRSTMAPGAARVRAMEGIIREMRKAAAREHFDPGEVSRWLRSGTEEQRMSALAAMQVRPELRDFEGLLTTAARPIGKNEQYHALLVLAAMVDDITPDQRRRLLEQVRALRAEAVPEGSDRWQVTEDIRHRAGRYDGPN